MGNTACTVSLEAAQLATGLQRRFSFVQHASNLTPGYEAGPSSRPRQATRVQENKLHVVWRQRHIENTTKAHRLCARCKLREWRI